MAATCMAVCKGSRKKIRGIFISSCHLPAAVECDIVILSEPGPNPTGPSWAVLQTQLIPARGRKQKRSCEKGHDRSDTTYPREGTETILTDPPYCSGGTQLIPARGRKPRCAGSRLNRIADTTYPREGTETGQSTAAAKDTDDTTYPREGTETLSAHLLSSFLKTQLIPARGRKQIISVLPDIK